MDWDSPYAVSRSLSIEVSRTGKLVARTSISRPPKGLALNALPVLMAFAPGATPRAALDGLSQYWKMDEAGFTSVVTALLDHGILAPLGGTRGAEAPAAAPASQGFGSILSHHAMLKYPDRALVYRAAIDRYCRDQTVVEIGCGTGILSLFAARAGARRVIAIEESAIASLAVRMFAANGLSEGIELRRANSRDVELDEPADVIVHEILGIDPFEENILPILRDARQRLLKPGGRLLPFRLEVCCLGVELKDEAASVRSRTLAEAREFEGTYGLDFGPYLEDLTRLGARGFQNRFSVRSGTFEPRILTGESRLLDIDLAADDLDGLGSAFEVRLQAERAGSLAGVTLFFRAHFDESLRLTTSPYAPVTSWGWDVRAFSRRVQVAPGDEVRVRGEVVSELGLQRLHLDLEEKS
jgi:protein arginine N-methyltransferase 1